MIGGEGGYYMLHQAISLCNVVLGLIRQTSNCFCKQC